MTIDLWELLVFLSGLLGSGVIAFYVLNSKNLEKLEKSLDARFKKQEELRKEAQLHWDARFNELKYEINTTRRLAEQSSREYLVLKTEVSNKYMLKEDFRASERNIDQKLTMLLDRRTVNG